MSGSMPERTELAECGLDAESPLRPSQATLSALMESAAEGILVVNDLGCIVLANRKSLEIFGYSRAELLGRPIHLLVPVDLRNHHVDRCAGYFADPYVRPMGQGLELHGRRKDGSRVPVEISLSAVETEEGVFALTFVVDISARKETEDRLREALAELEQQVHEVDLARSQARAILDAASDAMVLISPEGRILSVNRAFYRLFYGQQPVDVVGHVFDESIADLGQIFDDPAGLAALIRDTLTDRELEFTQFVAQHWPEQRELELSSAPVLGADGEYLGRLYVLDDFTYERQVDRMKTEFVSLVSHELRTPLTSVKGFTDLILDGDAGEINDEVREYLGIVKQDTDRLVALINDLLDISRIESGRIQLDLEPVDVPQAVQAAVVPLLPRFEEKGQSLDVEVQSGLPAIWADRDRVLQVLTNLLSNAHKYTPAGGAICLEVSQQGEQVRFAVSDTGIGIALEDQARLFTRFYRVDNSLTRDIGGTGLGLAIVKSIVEMHGGAVSVDSELGRGATFAAAFPQARGQARPGPSEAQPAAAPAPGGRSILVVEDEPSIAQLIRRHLERQGHHVAIAGSAEDAMARIAGRRPDLITLDIKLPGMDGLTFAERLGRSPETADIPILIISVLHDEAHGLQLNGVEALSKPIDRDTLIERVGVLLARSVRKRVLAVDDDPSVRRLLSVALSKQGFEVLEAPDGPTGLALARAEQPGLILLDLRLPGMDGFAVLEELKGDPNTAHLPVVAITGSEGLIAGAKARILALGAADFIQKPLDIEQLVQEVRALTAGG